MMTVRILWIDDNPTADLFERLLGVEVPYHDLLSGSKISLALNRQGEELSLQLRWLPEKRLSRVVRSIPAAVLDEEWDLILIDDDWGADGQTAGQDEIFSCIVGNVSHEPTIVLFTVHWDQPDRSDRFGGSLSELGASPQKLSLPYRVWGMRKSDRPTFSLLLHKVLAEKELRARLKEAHARLKVYGDHDGFRGDLIGESAVMRGVYGLIGRAAPADITVLISGESGTGKELVAKAIHDGSQRKSKAFLAINCAALSDQLLESELFGHEKGAFTGADARRSGKFEQAHGGTLFLDELGEMNLSMQAKLLRVLEGHAFQRIGGPENIKCDVRVVAATNADLLQMVKSKRFREDLYYRVKVFPIVCPPLRDRTGDVALLANHFADHLVISSAAQLRLEQYSWPGNVRELKNTIEAASVLSNGRVIEAEHLLLEKEGRDDTKFSPSKLGQAEEWLDKLEQAAQSLTGKTLTQAALAGELGLSGPGSIQHYFKSLPMELDFHLQRCQTKWTEIRKANWIDNLLTREVERRSAK